MTVAGDRRRGRTTWLCAGPAGDDAATARATPRGGRPAMRRSRSGRRKRRLVVLEADDELTVSNPGRPSSRCVGGKLNAARQAPLRADPVNARPPIDLRRARLASPRSSWCKAARMQRQPDDRERLPRPRTGRGRWTSFVADEAAGVSMVRALHEETNPDHRLRVEHDAHTLLLHLSDEHGGGWTTIAVDRTTRRWAVAQGRRQADTAQEAYDGLYET